MGVASLVLGILSLLIGFIPCVGWIAFLPAILGVIFGIVGIVTKGKNGQGRGMPIAGLILSVIAIVIIFVWTVLIGAAASSSSTNELVKSLDEISNSLNSTYEYNYNY